MTDHLAVLGDVGRATEGLLGSVRRLTDADLAAPSLLPGWTRGHVLAHVARNADSLVNLLTWARTGVPTPQYPSQHARDADIEAGAPRPAAEQITDLQDSAERFRAAAAALPADAWDAVVRKRGGAEIAVRDLPWARLREVEIHHVDLAAGYHPAQWPAEFAGRVLPEVVADFAGRRDVPPLRLRSGGLDAAIGAGTPAGTVSGAAADLVAWLIGRAGGTGLVIDPAGPFPRLPGWR